MHSGKCCTESIFNESVRSPKPWHLKPGLLGTQMLIQHTHTHTPHTPSIPLSTGNLHSQSWEASVEVKSGSFDPRSAVRVDHRAECGQAGRSPETRKSQVVSAYGKPTNLGSRPAARRLRTPRSSCPDAAVCPLRPAARELGVHCRRPRPPSPR
jgi:hypothetical protein